MIKPFDLSQLDCKLVAILRGIQPFEAADIVTVLIETGFRAIEIPLNSPDPFNSIEIALGVADKLAPDSCLIGAGTVLTTHDVDQVSSIGGNLCVSPNTNAGVIQQTIAQQMISMPGVLTPTEALLALASGASALKFFPGSLLGANGINAIKTILPEGTQVYAVGGIGPADFSQYMNANVDGFGMGTGLYRPGDGPQEVLEKARKTMTSYKAAIV